MKIVVTAAQMNAADQFTIQSQGVSGLELMEKAARHCFQVLVEKTAGPCSVAVLAGGGNNGGDGFALARMLAEAQYQVSVFAFKSLQNCAPDAAENYRRLLETGVTPQEVSTPEDLVLPSDLNWLVDSMLGTGLQGAPKGLYAEAIEILNQHPAPVLAVDLPSGLSGNHGQVLGRCVQGDVTVTFQNLKWAHVLTPACLACGEVVVVDLGISFPDVDDLNGYLCQAEDYHRKPRSLASHKGSFGYLGILGGFKGMVGAANLAGLAGLRFGAGKVRLFGDQHHNLSRHDSLMTAHWHQLIPHELDSLVIGPGLSRDAALFDELKALDVASRPIVWDADGLYLLKQLDTIPGTPWIMTPHPGEAAYLLGCHSKDIQADRLGSLKALTSQFPGGWIVLKGYRTLVGSPSGECFVIGTGNASLATAGTGDVLAGMIGAMCAQGRPAEEAILLACLRHGMGADRWILQHPDHSMIAEDLIEDLKYHP